ncbi:MAG TPA: hypothetical protein VGQ59_03550 [Cyclobacteriaceae bacterium]|jgi:hypothetical protein|nr:hypothetical protein [Cyclobacteriaceae bacterium]
MPQHFGRYVNEKRIEKELTLREFCKQTSFVPSVWSKVDRGLSDYGRSGEMIDRIKSVLALDEKEIEELENLAKVEYVPFELTEQDTLNFLPLLVSTVRGEKPKDDELHLLYKKVKESNHNI